MTTVGRPPSFIPLSTLETFAEEDEENEEQNESSSLELNQGFRSLKDSANGVTLHELRRVPLPSIIHPPSVNHSKRTSSFIKEAHSVDFSVQRNRRASIVAAMTASGGNKRRSTFIKVPFVMKTQAQIRWDILRKHVLSKNMIHPLGRYLSDPSKTQPYSQILKMGFHYQHSLKHDQTILMLLSHSYFKARPGIVGAEAMEQAYQSGLSANKDDSSTATVKTAKVTAIVTVNRTRQISVWDMTSKRPKWTLTMDSDLKNMIFLSKHAVYAACFLESHVYFYDMNMEIVHEIRIPFPVQLVRYNEHWDTLVVVGLTAVAIWSLSEGIVKSKHVTVIESPFPLDQWIADVLYIERTNSVLIAIDTNLIVYNLSLGFITDRALNATGRKITCISFHPRYEYILVGSTDGVIKVFNVNCAIVHAFRVHISSITALDIYPQGYLFLSSSLDKTFRLFDLKTMSEVYCNRVMDTPPLSIKMVNDQMFYVHMRDRVELWHARHLHHSLLLSSSPVDSISYIKNQNFKAARVIVRTVDETIRILCPKNGKPITIMLPFVQAKEIISVAYCLILDKMYLLRTSGDIWVVSTKFNPCRLLEVWQQDDAGFESITSLCMFDGQLQSWNTPAGYNREDGYAMLFGATETGQVILFDKTGNIDQRFQLHEGSIIQMSCSSKNQCIVTLGKDSTLKISQVLPLTRQLLATAIVIDIKHNPTMFSLTDLHICVASRDNTVFFYQFNLFRKEEYRSVFGHDSSEDHTDTVTSMSGIPQLGLFVTTSKDMTLKIWDLEGSLLREIQFQQPLNAVSAFNTKGDLILGIKDRLDVLKHHHYLPPNYIWAVSKMACEEEVVEKPILFNSDFDPQSQSVSGVDGLRKNTRRNIQSAMRTSLEIFNSINLLEKSSKTIEVPKAGNDPKIDGSSTSTDNAAIQQNVSAIQQKKSVARRRQTSQRVAENKQLRSSSIFPKSTMRLPTPEKQSIIASIGNHVSDWEADSQSKAENAVLSNDEKFLSKSNDAVSLPLINNDVKESDRANDTPITPARPTGKKKQLTVAPDGYVPNSTTTSKVQAWKRKIGEDPLITERRPITLQEKLKIKRALDQTIETIPIARAVTPEMKLEEIRSRLPKNKFRKKFIDKVSVEDVEQSPIVSEIPNPADSLADVKEEEEEDYPELVIKVLATDWFPADEILEPEIKHNSSAKGSPIESKRNGLPDDVPQSDVPKSVPNDISNSLQAQGAENNQKVQETTNEPTAIFKKRKRKLKINPTPKNIIGICLRKMSLETIDVKRRISTFLNNLSSTDRNSTDGAVTNSYLEQLSGALLRIPSNEESSYYLDLIKDHLKFTPENTDIFPILLLFTLSPKEDMKKMSLAILREMGVNRAESPHVVSFISFVLKEGPKRYPFSFEKQIKFYRGMILYWLRHHFQAYLVRCFPDDKDLKKVVKYNLLTGLDESVVDYNTRQKVTEAISIKPQKKYEKLDDSSKFEVTRVFKHDPSLPDFGFHKAYKYRAPLSMISKPLNVDFAVAVNFFALMTEKQIQALDEERLLAEAKAQEAQRKMEEDRVKAERLKAAKEMKEKQAVELERLKREKIEAVKAQIAANKEKARNKKVLMDEARAASRLSRVMSSSGSALCAGSLQHGSSLTKSLTKVRDFHSLSHSKCHPSREVWDAAYCIFFFRVSMRVILMKSIIGNFPKPSESHTPHVTSSLSLHYAAFNKSLVIDHVTLDPFGGQKKEPNEPARRLESIDERPHASKQSRHSAALQIHNFSESNTGVNDDLVYIRQGLPQKPFTKTNLPYLSDATSTVDTNLTAVAPEDYSSVLDPKVVGSDEDKRMLSQRRYFMPRLAVAWDSLVASEPELKDENKKRQDLRS